MDLRELYAGRIAGLEKEAAVLKQKKKNYGLGRLLTFVAAVVLFFALLEVNGILAASVAIVLLLLFLLIALKDMENTRRLHFRQSLLRINAEELKALSNDHSAFNGGAAFLPDEHLYAHDLDIFGEHSLFQFINRTTAAPSEALLAERLLDPLPQNSIAGVQEAVRELQPAIDWRQQLQAKGRRSPVTPGIYRQILAWSGESRGEETGGPAFKWLTVALPLATLSCIILAYAGLLPWKILWLSFCAHLLLAWQINKAASPAYHRLSEAVKAIDALYDSLAWMVNRPFASPYLKALQQSCYNDGIPAHQWLNRLKKILHRMDLRLNPLVHFPLNLAVFTDWHHHRQLRHWQQQHAHDLLRWIAAYAGMEVTASFANMAFNHPGWCFPEIAEHFTFSASSLGHPLLPDDKRITNDAAISGAGKIMLITGSNMAGKSTFLRTVGVNMILAMAGAPVCAESMTVSETKVISSMRIADNLEENISTFYAELKKLEIILQRVRAHEKVFLLLDEILRGTNSQDRHAGARALIRQFLTEGAVGILATHDLALTSMADEYPGRLLNYHFDVQVQDEELYFDYKLKPGICTSMNASLLMRKIGIDV